MSQRIIDMLQQEEPDYHPLVSMLRISKEEKADLRLKFDCHREIAKYVEAQRKSVDVKSGDGSELITLNISLGGEEEDEEYEDEDDQ